MKLIYMVFKVQYLQGLALDIRISTCFPALVNITLLFMRDHAKLVQHVLSNKCINRM